MTSTHLDSTTNGTKSHIHLQPIQKKKRTNRRKKQNYKTKIKMYVLVNRSELNPYQTENRCRVPMHNNE